MSSLASSALTHQFSSACKRLSLPDLRIATTIKKKPFHLPILATAVLNPLDMAEGFNRNDFRNPFKPTPMYLNTTNLDTHRKDRLGSVAESIDEPYSPISLVSILADPGRRQSVFTDQEGMLDLSSQRLSDDMNDMLSAFLRDNEVKQILLQANRITCIPPALWMGQGLCVLDFSDNTMSIDYFSDELYLPLLREITLNRCRISSWDPLLSNLQAPKLQTLNINANRLGFLPVLKTIYPELATVAVSDNRISSTSADQLRGLHAVNLASNKIEQLSPEIGLLWDEGLRTLQLGGNPLSDRRLLEQETEAVLQHLRNELN